MRQISRRVIRFLRDDFTGTPCSSPGQQGPAVHQHIEDTRGGPEGQKGPCEDELTSLGSSGPG